MLEENQILALLRIHIQDSQLRCTFKDEFLLCFLRSRRYDIDRAFKSLKRYMQMIESYPELMMGNLKESELHHQFSKRLQVISKGRDHLGRRIFIFRAGRWNPEESSLDDIFRCNLYCLQLLASDPSTQKNGIVAIVDLQNLGLHQARHFTPGYAKKIADLLTESFPLSFQAIHIVNQNWIISFLMSIIFPLLTAKIRSRIHNHGSGWTSLHQHVDPSDLPEDYGGHQQPLDCWKETIMANNREETENLFYLK